MTSFTKKFPQTVEAAVDKITAEMSLRDKTRIANMNEAKLIEFHLSYGIYLKNEFRLWGNDPLMASCREISGLKKLSPDQASYIILKEIQERLQQSGVLRVIK